MKMRFLLIMLIGVGIDFSCLAAAEGDGADKENRKIASHDKNGIFYTTKNEILIQNPDFSNGTSYWTLGKFNGGSADFYTDSVSSVLNGHHAVVLSNGSFSQQFDDIQLFSFLELSKNSIYSITFSASVLKASLISISIGNGMDSYYEEKLMLRPGQNLYGPFTFKSDVDESFAFFSFNLGRTTGKLCLDEVSITEDNTERQFHQVVENTGINIHAAGNGKELFIQLPVEAKTEYPVIFANEKGRAIKTSSIPAGNRELWIQLDENMQQGNYVIKVFSPEKVLAYRFNIR